MTRCEVQNWKVKPQIVNVKLTQQQKKFKNPRKGVFCVNVSRFVGF